MDAHSGLTSRRPTEQLRFGRVLSLAAGYFVFAVLVNMAHYDTLESALPSIVNSFIWTSVFFLIPIGLVLWMLVSSIRRRTRPLRAAIDGRNVARANSVPHTKEKDLG